MMHFTEMSGIMAFLWSSVFILFLYYIRIKGMHIQRSEIACIVMLYIFSAIRLMVPVDFVPSIGLDMPPDLSQAVEEIFWIKRRLGEISFTIAQVFVIVWITGTVIRLIQYIKQYNKVANSMNFSEEYQEAEIIMEKVQDYVGKKVKIDVREGFR